MADNQEMAREIGQAWKLHREGHNDEAIAGFEQVLAAVPDSIDALYGIGLAQRVVGKTDEAIQSFQKALDLSNSSYQSLQESKVEKKSTKVVLGINDLASPEDDRLMMLQRMIAQRLSELGVVVEADIPRII